MPVEIKEVTSRRDRREFIYLPEKIHQNHDGWLPPIYMDEKNYFNPKKNPAFDYSETILSLAYRDGRPVGRIMGIINNRYNELYQERQARFGYLECWNEPEVADALLDYVEDWARKYGMQKIIGPFGFTDQDPEGLIIEGFEHHATIATYYNYQYMVDLVETHGYQKEIDYVVYRVNATQEIPDFYRKIHHRVTRTAEFSLLEFQKRKEVKPYAKPVFRLMNDCFKDIYGYTPLDEREMEELAKQYLPVLDPRFVKFVEREGELVAFIIGIPDMSDGIRKARGRLFPFGIFKILRSAKKTKQLDLLLGGVKEEYRGRGLDVMMGYRMVVEAQAAGMEIIDSHHELENNTMIRAEMERMDGEIYKRYRIYQKDL